MLTRRTLLKTSAAVTAVTMAGLDAALAMPQGKLVGDSFFCLKCIANGNVALEDVERVSISHSAFVRLQHMDADAREIKDYLARGIYTRPHKAAYYASQRMEFLQAAAKLDKAGKLYVNDAADYKEPAAIAWTRNGQPFDSGSEIEPDDYFRFGMLLSMDDLRAYYGPTYNGGIIAQIIC